MKKSELAQKINFHCPKCANSQSELGEMFVAGSLWSKFFKFPEKRFTTVTCARCNYTEFYRTEKRMGRYKTAAERY